MSNYTCVILLVETHCRRFISVSHRVTDHFLWHSVKWLMLTRELIHCVQSGGHQDLQLEIWIQISDHFWLRFQWMIGIGGGRVVFVWGLGRWHVMDMSVTMSWSLDVGLRPTTWTNRQTHTCFIKCPIIMQMYRFTAATAGSQQCAGCVSLCTLSGRATVVSTFNQADTLV